MSGDVFGGVGAIGCNFCGNVFWFNCRNRKVVWLLCKNCKFVYTRGGPAVRTPMLPGQRFTRPPCVDLSGPHGVRTLIQNWDTGDTHDVYNFLYDSDDPRRPREDRCIYVGRSLTGPDMRETDSSESEG